MHPTRYTVSFDHRWHGAYLCWWTTSLVWYDSPYKIYSVIWPSLTWSIPLLVNVSTLTWLLDVFYWDIQFLHNVFIIKVSFPSDIGSLIWFCLSCLGPLVYLLSKDFYIIWFSNLMTLMKGIPETLRVHWSRYLFLFLNIRFHHFLWFWDEVQKWKLQFSVLFI
jgi:hypothetical protein